MAHWVKLFRVKWSGGYGLKPRYRKDNKEFLLKLKNCSRSWSAELEQFTLRSLNKVFSSDFCVGSRTKHETSKESQSSPQSKQCECYNEKIRIFKVIKTLSSALPFLQNFSFAMALVYRLKYAYSYFCFLNLLLFFDFSWISHKSWEYFNGVWVTVRPLKYPVFSLGV